MPVRFRDGASQLGRLQAANRQHGGGWSRAAHNPPMPKTPDFLPQPAPSNAAKAWLANALQGESSALVQAVRTALPNALALYAFGSQVTGTARADSDLDLAVLVAGYADPLPLWELSLQLADWAGCAVDLLDMRAASTVMQYQVLLHGKRLWAKDVQADLFECFVCSEKLNLDEARAGILADIQASGRVYAG